jgi:hypothetical protein
MKHVMMPGLAAVAATVLLALGGIGSASATVLCKTTPALGSACESPYPSSTVLDLSLEEASTRETLEGTVLDECTGSTIKGTTSNKGSATETVSDRASELTWTGCTRETKTTMLGTLEIHNIPGTHNGTLTGSGFEVTLNGIFNTSCIWGTGTALDLGTLKASTSTTTPATILINAEVPRTVSNFLCPSKTRWTAAYKVAEPVPLYVTAS